MAKFNAQNHITKLKGKDYLEVKWRLVWVREEHPVWSIESTPQVLSEGVAIVRTVICDDDGRLISTGMATVRSASGNVAWSGRDFEKAETAAIGRALAHAGYGTQFTGEDEGDYLADSPVERKAGYPIEQEGVTTEPTTVIVTKINASTNKPYLIIDGCSFWNRDPFRRLSYDDNLIDELSGEGVHNLPDPVEVEFNINSKNHRTAQYITRISTGLRLKI